MGPFRPAAGLYRALAGPILAELWALWSCIPFLFWLNVDQIGLGATPPDPATYGPEALSTGPNGPERPTMWAF